MATPTTTGSTPAISNRALYLGFAAATTGTLMVNIDSTIVNVVLPLMQHDFGLPLASLQWAVTAYVLVITGTLPAIEQVTRYIGRRRMLTLGLAIFTIASLLGAMAPNFALLLVARALQGVGGAIIQVNVMAIVTLTFPQERRGQALGMIGSVVAAGTLAGPALGGLLTAVFDWRSVFWVNLPFGIWGVFAVRRFLPDFPRELHLTPRGMDWGGALLFATAAAVLQFGLASPTTLTGAGLLLLSVVLVIAFIRVERTHPRAVVRLDLFRIRTFSSNLGSGVAFYVLMMFPAFLLPFYLHAVLHQPQWVVGLSLVPQAVATAIVSPFGGRLADRAGVLLPGRLGFALFLVADLAIAAPGTVPLWAVWTFSAATGVAAGLVMAPNNSAILNSVRKSETGLASAIIATQRNLGRNIGVAIAALVPSLYWLAIGAGASPSSHTPGYALLFRDAFRVSFVVAPIVALLGLLLMRAPQPAPVEPAVTGAGDAGAAGSTGAAGKAGAGNAGAGNAGAAPLSTRP